MMAIAKRLLAEEEGQSMAEYGILLAGIAVAAMGAVALLGGQIKEIFDAVKGALNSKP